MSSSRKVSRAGEVAPLRASAGEEEEALLGEDMVPRAHRDPGSTPEHAARYRWAAELVAGGSVLDVGCGTGAGAALLARRGSAVTGIDVSLPFVDAATRRHGDVAEFHVADAVRLPFADQRFDAVVCFETIEQVAELEPALAEMQRVLRAGGLALISCANRDVYPAGNPLHRRELTSAELCEAVGRSFAHVAPYRQHRYVTSLIGDDSTLAHAGLDAPLEADAAKISGTAPGRELFTIVLASDADLPKARAVIVLGGEDDPHEQRRLAASWAERAVRAETEAGALRREIERLG